MSAKVTGKNSNALGYFGSLLAIFSVAVLALFVAQLILAEGSFTSRLFATDMLYLQLLILSILAPSLAFCSYLSLGLKLTSSFFKLALLCAAVAMLPIFPLVSPFGLYTIWLSRKAADGRPSSR